MKRKILSAFLLILTLGLAATIVVRAASDIRIVIDGKPVDSNVEIVNDSSYVPLRSIAEMFGANVEWDNSSRTINIVSHRRMLNDISAVYKEDGITFSNVSLMNKEYGWEITTDVWNGQDIAYRGLHFKASFFDQHDRLLGTSDGYLFDLKPGVTKVANLVTTDDLTDYKYVQFQLDLTY
ncbi:copper amine oxidase N-terminal domain-containing protein [Paenibacillus sp. HWE-109]|uniref:copper amine oxidase N-terminal domain-containing protein n=1 Tax=Paenibacillus sp. HWE-109 TaxID=1306526 RepID=UPI001EE0D4D0|nr:copper amine oxidase N-terminal domain-containing protein [Paenibacillus sp. HWE-109]UKS25793.1 copper amine oxidase N-terminal domain-containing protein [Paenibacillus sp. HWE-109]